MDKMRDPLRPSLVNAAIESREIGDTSWFWWPMKGKDSLRVGVYDDGGIVHYKVDIGDDVGEVTANEVIRIMERRFYSDVKDQEQLTGRE